MNLKVECQTLRAELEIARGQLAAFGLEKIDVRPEWAAALTNNEWRLAGLLIGAHPRALDIYTIEDELPKQDHVLDRDVKIVSIYVCKVRKKLGRDAIETVWGQGFRAGPGLMRHDAPFEQPVAA